jgi:DNA polymerase-3 subunit delta
MAKSAAAKSGVVNALEFLSHPDKFAPGNVCAVFGDDAFLKGEVLVTLRRKLISGDDAEFGLSVFAGREVQLRDIHDSLASVCLFGDGQRVVIVEEADSFVSEYRAELEDFVAKPARGVLILDVKTWPSNTRLAKAVTGTGLAIKCEAPNERQIKAWLTQRAKSVHNVRLDSAAADTLLELVPPELGILVQEIAKLELVVGPDRVISEKLVQENVGGWRTRQVWDMVDAAAEGRAAEALGYLDRLITSGEKPFGLLPQMSSTLRKFAIATQIIEAAEKSRQRISHREALSQAGIPPFKLGDAERQLRQLGRQRAKQLTEWLLATDLAMKSHNSSDDRARMELERLIVRLSAASNAASAADKRTATARS